LFGGVVAGGIEPAQEGADGQQTHGGAREGTGDDQAVGSAEAVRRATADGIRNLRKIYAEEQTREALR